MTEADEIAGRLEAEFVRRTGKSPDEASSDELRDFLETIEAEADGSDGFLADQSPDPKREVVNLHLPHKNEWKGSLQDIGGSKNDNLNHMLIDQVSQALWIGNLEPERRDMHFAAGMAALAGVGPQGEIEGMVAAQMVAAHAATMECYRRAMVPTQTTEVRAMNLGMANKSSRTFAALLEALNRHRGKGGKQTVRVEHVHVHAGGQAVVGVVDTQGGEGDGRKNAKRPHAKHIVHAPEPPLPSTDAQWNAMPVPRDEERALPDARRDSDRWPKGEQSRPEARAIDGEGEGRAAPVRRDDAGDAPFDQDD
jgi:hypothetical protein